MDHSRKIDTIVGIFVVGALFSFVWMILNASSFDTSGSKQSILVFAEFDNVGSLKSKAPILLSGVKVGRVENITLDKNNFHAVVQMSLYSDIPLPVDTNASIWTAGLVGEQYIALSPGGALEDLKDGDKLKFTQSALVLERLIGQFITNMQQSSGSEK